MIASDAATGCGAARSACASGSAQDDARVRDALECFFTSPLDVLAIGRYIVRKPAAQRAAPCDGAA
jgi:hypothetical protein